MATRDVPVTDEFRMLHWDALDHAVELDRPDLLGQLIESIGRLCGVPPLPAEAHTRIYTRTPPQDGYNPEPSASEAGRA